MKTKPLTQLLIAILSIGLFTAHPRALNAAALTPRAVMEAVQDRADGETPESEMNQNLIDPRNKQRSRQPQKLRNDFQVGKKVLVLEIDEVDPPFYKLLNFSNYIIHRAGDPPSTPYIGSCTKRAIVGAPPR